jgi:hypothetical protein
MALKLVKETDQQSQPHLRALRDNKAAMRALRVQLDALNEKDRKAAADQALCEATEQQIATVQQDVDTLRADAAYSNQPPPDTRAQDAKLQSLQQLLKKQSDNARAATLIRTKYDSDRQTLTHEISTRGQANKTLLFNAMEQDRFVPLASKYFAAVATMRAVLQELYAHARVHDVLSAEIGAGTSVGSLNIFELCIPCPVHPAFNPNPFIKLPEQVADKQYLNDIANAAVALELELLKEGD